jgi:hypothetical protein
MNVEDHVAYAHMAAARLAGYSRRSTIWLASGT